MITKNQNNLNRNTGCTYFCVNEEHGKHSYIPGFVSFTWLHLSIAILKLFNDTFLPIYRLNLSIYITSCNHVTKSYRNSILLDYIQWIFSSNFNNLCVLNVWDDLRQLCELYCLLDWKMSVWILTHTYENAA